MRKINKKLQPVANKVYNKKYFLSDCGGYQNFLDSRGLVIDERIAKSLKLANVEPDMYILDIGSGRGEIVLQCALKKANSIGIDYSFDAIQLATELKKKYEKTGEKMTFIRGSALELPFRNNVFDRIFLMDLLEHLHDNELKKMFYDINKVLKDSGILIIHTAPNKLYNDYGYKFIRFILYILKGIKIEKDIRSDYDKKVHVNEQTKRSIIKLLFQNHYAFKYRLSDNSHLTSLIKENFHNIFILNIFDFILNWPLLAIFFNRDIYAIAWKNSKIESPPYVNTVFNDFEIINEIEYRVPSKENLNEGLLSDCILMGFNDKGVIGGNWYSFENWPPKIRWTNKKASAYLKKNDKSSKLKIQAISPHVKINLKVTIYDKIIENFSLEDFDWNILDVKLPDLNTDIIEVLIEVDRTWIPDEIIQNGDKRELGIAVHKIWVE